MNNNEIFPYIDHTELKAAAVLDDVFALCDEVVKLNTASVCIAPSFVKAVREKYSNLNICTVIGFPLGYNTSAVKAFETKQAVLDGADEIDMVINIGWAKSHLWDDITNEIKLVRSACCGKILKVIIETCYLSDDEKICLCKCVSDSGADFIKTSTGFGTGGANLHDIALFKDNIAPNVRMKAAGGVKSKEDLEAFISAGCSRIGTSSAVKILLHNTSSDY